MSYDLRPPRDFKIRDTVLGSFPGGVPPKPAESTAVRELRALLGPLVAGLLRGADGSLDLTKIKADSFEEFRDFLKTQVSVDHKSLNQYELRIGSWRAGLSAYHKVLAEEKYRPLLHLLYQATQTGPDSDRPERSRLDALLKEFTAEIIEVSADGFVAQHGVTKGGRDRLRRILGDGGYFSKEVRADLLKAIASAGESRGEAGVHFEGITRQISVWNYFNFNVSDAEVEKATVHAFRILDESERREDESGDRENRYARAPETVALLASPVAGRVPSTDDVRRYYRIDQENQGRPDSLSQLKAKLARLWLMAVDDGIWTEGNSFVTAERRARVAGEAERLLQKAEFVSGEADMRELNGEVQRFLQAPLPTPEEGKVWAWLKHRMAGYGLNELCAGLPSGPQAPYLELKQFSDELAHAADMGEKIFSDTSGLRAEDPQVRAAALHLIEGLEQTKRSLWFGYKQHRALSRGFSQTAQLWDGGDIAEIRQANRRLDGMIARLKGAGDRAAVEGAVTGLYGDLKAGGVLQRALGAAELDGIEQLIGLGQTVLVILGTTAVTGGWGTASVAANLAQRVVYGMRMGSWISLAENGIASATGEVRNGPDHLLNWGKDALATSAAMGLFTPLVVGAGHALEQNVLKNLLRRYFTGGVKGWVHFGGDTAVEGMEEVFDAALRMKLDGRRGGLSWDQLREITAISAMGGGTKMGALAQGFAGAKSPDGAKNPWRGEAVGKELAVPIHWAPALAGAAAGISAVFNAPTPDAAVFSAAASGNSHLLGWGLGLGALGMAMVRKRKKGSDPSAHPPSADPARAKPLRSEMERLLQSSDPDDQMSGVEILGRIFAEESPSRRLHAALRLGKFLSHDNPRVRDYAYDAWMAGVGGLTTSHLKSLLNDAELFWDRSGLDTVAGVIGDMVQRLPEESRLAPSIKLVEWSGKLQGKEQRNIVDAMKGLLPILRIRDRDRVIGALERLNQSDSLSGPQRTQLSKLLDFSKRVSRSRSFFGLPWVILRSESDVLEGLSSPRPESRQEALRLLGIIFHRIDDPGRRLRYVIEAGVRGQSEALAQWSELQDVLEEIRSAMDPMDVSLADLGIAAKLNGDQVVSDYAGTLKPREVEGLRRHLWESYFKGMAPDQITAGRVPEVIVKLVKALQPRGDVPAWAEGRQLADRLKPPVKALPSRPPQPISYSSETERVLAEIGNTDPQIRERARGRILEVFGTLSDPAQRLDYAVQLGKKSHTPRLEQWEELHDTLHGLRQEMDYRDVEIADMGILLSMEGKDCIADLLSEMERGEIEDLRSYVRDVYLAGEEGGQSLAQAPEVIRRLWPEIQKALGRGPMVPGDLFSLSLGLGYALGAMGNVTGQGWMEAGLGFQTGGNLGLLTSLGLGLGAWAMVRKRSSSYQKTLEDLYLAGERPLDSAKAVLNHFKSLQAVAARILQLKNEDHDAHRRLRDLWNQFFTKIFPRITEDQVEDIFRMISKPRNPLSESSLLGLIHQLHPDSSVREKILEISTLDSLELRFGALKFLAQYRFDTAQNKFSWMKLMFGFLADLGEDSEIEVEMDSRLLKAIENLWERDVPRLVSQVTAADLGLLFWEVGGGKEDEVNFRLFLHTVFTKHPDPKVREAARQIDQKMEQREVYHVVRRIQDWPHLFRAYQQIYEQSGEEGFFNLIQSAILQDRQDEVLSQVNFLMLSRYWESHPEIREKILHHPHPMVRRAFYMLSLSLMIAKTPEEIPQTFERYWLDEFPTLTRDLMDPDLSVQWHAQYLWNFFKELMEGRIFPLEEKGPAPNKKKNITGDAGPFEN